MEHLTGTSRQPVDPIDDVRRRFECFYSGNYGPHDGDRISDDYFDVIELATRPTRLNDRDAGRMVRLIQRLNNNVEEGYMKVMLKDRQDPQDHGLREAYDGVAEQINDINSVDPSRSDIPLMLRVDVDREL